MLLYCGVVVKRGKVLQFDYRASVGGSQAGFFADFDLVGLQEPHFHFVFFVNSEKDVFFEHVARVLDTASVVDFLFALE